MIKPETQGKYLNQESAEEILREKRERAQARAEEQRRAAVRRSAVRRGLHWLGLVTVSGGMIYMILAGLIDQRIGVVLLAALSAGFGRGTA